MSDRCPVCLASSPDPLIDLRNVPILMHRLYETPKLAVDAPLAVLNLVTCRSCGFVWNRAFDPSKIEYDSSYENNQGYSEAFSEYLTERAEAILSSRHKDGRINYLEVGCGQGVFLELIVNRAGTQFQSAEGFDPAWRGLDGAGPAGSRIHKVYFNSSTSNRLSHSPSIVVTRHTIEHVPDPVEFLTAIRDALGEHSRATIYVETPNVRWIIENRAIQDFFYEHCSIFTAQSLALALQRSGFEQPAVEAVFGGQYLWAKACAGTRHDGQYTLQKGHGFEFQDKCSDFITEWSEKVSSARQKGTVALWGAGAKGVTFAVLVDPEGSLLDHAIDINPQKQGHFLPRTALPVVSPESSATRRPRTVFIMNPVYETEIRKIGKDAGIEANFVSIN